LRGNRSPESEGFAPFRGLVDRASIDEETPEILRGEDDMPVIAGFDKLASVPEEQITDKIRRRVVSGNQGTE
jgi:hypothetical protein